MKIGDTSALYINQLLTLARGLGANVERLLADAELEPAQLRDDENRIDLIYLMRLGRGVIQQTARPDLGLALGRNQTLGDYGYPGLAAMTAPDLGQALAAVMRYEPLLSRCYRGSSQLVRGTDSAALMFYSIAPYNDYNRFVVDAVLSGWQRLMQRLLQQPAPVLRVEIEFPAPDYLAAYGQTFSCPIQFEAPRNALILRPESLTQPLPESSPGLHQSLRHTCEDLLNRVALANSYRNKVLKVLGTMLHGETPSIEQVAQQLGIPSWTLRRKLKEEDCAYQALVDEIRRDVALSYMKNTELSFGEIAYLLGFSTPGTFQRAFKRWSGQTPGEFRNSLDHNKK